MKLLCQLTLNRLMQLDIPLQRVDLILHLVVLGQQLLRLLGLVVELGGQLVVLKGGEAGGRVDLFFVQGSQISLGFLDLVLHICL